MARDTPGSIDESCQALGRDEAVRGGDEFAHLFPVDRSGELHTRYPTSRGLPDAGAIFSAGMLESVFDICRVSGTVRFTAWTSEARNDAKYDVRW